MNIESLLPFALLITPFILVFLIEGLVICFFKLKRLWPAFGTSVLINILSVVIIIYGIMALLGKLGYEFNGLDLPVPVIFFLWWFSTIVDGLLLQLFCRKAEKRKLFMASMLMNAFSYFFLYIFIINSH
jgi:hypothetical protein